MSETTKYGICQTYRTSQVGRLRLVIMCCLDFGPCLCAEMGEIDYNEWCTSKSLEFAISAENGILTHAESFEHYDSLVDERVNLLGQLADNFASNEL